MSKRKIIKLKQYKITTASIKCCPNCEEWYNDMDPKLVEFHEGKKRCVQPTVVA